MSIRMTGYYTPKSDVTLYATWIQPDLALPASLITIESEAFTGGAFRYVKLSENTVSIGWHAFANCPNLTYIYIPEATKEIDPAAFDDLNALTILGKPKSTAEEFAKEHHYTFIEAP